MSVTWKWGCYSTVQPSEEPETFKAASCKQHVTNIQHEKGVKDIVFFLQVKNAHEVARLKK